MNFYFALQGLLLVAFMCDAAFGQSRTYHNSKDTVIPLAIKRDDEAIKDSAVDLKENETVHPIRNLETKIIPEQIASVVGKKQKLEAVEAVIESQRHIDEAIVLEGIKGAVKKEQDKKIIQTLEGEKISETSVTENSEIEAVIQPESNKKKVAEVVREFDEALTKKLKNQHQVLVILDANNDFDDEAAEPDGAVRQDTSQQHVVRQLLQNSPLGIFINQLYAQAADQANSDETTPEGVPSRPGFFQQFAANLQEQEDVFPARPPRPFFSNFIANNQ